MSAGSHFLPPDSKQDGPLDEGHRRIAAHESSLELPLTAAQMGIWVAQMMDPSNPSFNIAEYIELNGCIDPTRFDQALHQVVTETETLRVQIVECSRRAAADHWPAATVVNATDQHQRCRRPTRSCYILDECGARGADRFDERAAVCVCAVQDRSRSVHLVRALSPHHYGWLQHVARREASGRHLYASRDWGAASWMPFWSASFLAG
jgi:hypothetical protein